MDAERGGRVSDRAREQLVVALDVADYESAECLVEVLAPHAGWFKIGSILFTREGPRVCRLIKDSGARLFLDLKYHDIPNTVAGAVRSAIDTGADMLTIHMSGGRAMAEAAAGAKPETSKTLIVGVTVLTHLTFEDFHTLYESERKPENTVLAFAQLAADTGLDGVVASARELPLLREHMNPGFKIVTPGIRLPGDDAGDQTRIATPGAAVRDGADYLVVGRPITAAADPAQACRQILADMVA